VSGGSQRNEIRWTTISIPENIYQSIKMRARSRGLALWRLIYDAVVFYDAARRKHFQLEGLEAQKKIYYIVKLAMSAGQFKENPSDENLAYLHQNCARIKEVFGVETQQLIAAAEVYRAKRTEKSKVAINTAVRDIALAILLSEPSRNE